MLAPIGAWRRAIVREVMHPNPMAVVLRLAVPDRIDHLPGQHYVIRLRADDGYTASRSYSLSSPPSDDLIEMYVERLDDGEPPRDPFDRRKTGARDVRRLRRVGRSRPRCANMRLRARECG